MELLLLLFIFIFYFILKMNRRRFEIYSGILNCVLNFAHFRNNFNLVHDECYTKKYKNITCFQLLKQ